MPQINFSPSKKQDQAWEYLTDNKTNFIGYGGSARSGKSFLGVNWLTIMSLAYPGTAWGLGRKELKNLKRTTLVTLFNLFRDSQIEKDIHYGFNQQDKVITFFNIPYRYSPPTKRPTLYKIWRIRVNRVHGR